MGHRVYRKVLPILIAFLACAEDLGIYIYIYKASSSGFLNAFELESLDLLGN